MNKIIELILTFLKSFIYAFCKTCVDTGEKPTINEKRKEDHPKRPSRTRRASITETTTKTTEFVIEGSGNTSSGSDPEEKKSI